MIKLASEMAKDPKKKSVEAHLNEDQTAAFELVRQRYDWSGKKLNEKIIIWFLKNEKKLKIDLNKSE